MTFNAFTAPSANSKKWRATKVTWEDIVGWALMPASRKDCGGYVLGTFHGDERRTSALISREVLTLDVDHRGNGIPARVKEMGVRSLVHTTFSSAPDDLRYRILLPLSCPVKAGEYEMLAETVALHLGIESFDRTSFRPAQFMWKPACANPEWYDFQVTTGPDLDVEEWMARYNPAEVASSRTTGRVKKRDPTTLEGFIGVFNRRYDDLDELIERFELPYVKEGEDRYRYAEATSVAGMGPIVGAPGLYFSHHASDPAGGKALSAYDLVRVHKFGDEDYGARSGTPVHNLPSSKAMNAFIESNPDLRILSNQEVLKDFAMDIDPTATEKAEATSWVLQLQLKPRGTGFENSVANLRLIFANDPALKIAFNEMSNTIHAVGLFPWDDVDPHARPGHQLQEHDRAHIKHHVEEKYGIKMSDQQVAEYILTSARNRMFNPVRDWITSLRWDGKKRLEHCLPGVLDSPFSRLAARVCVVGAVARIMDPGCHMDNSLILYGKEGVGKSRWMRHMAVNPEWYGELGDVHNKDTLMVLVQKWILVSDEVDAMGRAGFDTLKSFLTKTHDNFRLPYARESGMYPRHCAIWGTTNDKEFLKEQEGNRRFFIVECINSDERVLDEEWVAQVWAEALHVYRVHGEKAYVLSDTEADMARKSRSNFTQDDPLSGLVKEYLEMDVPAGWDSMDTETRRHWWERGRLTADPDIYIKQRVTSVQAIYAELIAGPNAKMPREGEVKRITNVLRKVPGWEEVGRTWVPIYGNQVTFRRVEEGVALLGDLL